MIRRGDAHRVDVFIIQQLPQIRVASDLEFVLIKSIHTFTEHLTIDITQGRDAHAFVFKFPITADVGATTPTEADDSHVHRITRAFLRPRGFSDVENASRCGDGLVEEAAAGVHGVEQTRQPQQPFLFDQVTSANLRVRQAALHPIIEWHLIGVGVETGREHQLGEFGLKRRHLTCEFRFDD